MTFIMLDQYTLSVIFHYSHKTINKLAILNKQFYDVINKDSILKLHRTVSATGYELHPRKTRLHPCVRFAIMKDNVNFLRELMSYGYNGVGDSSKPRDILRFIYYYDSVNCLEYLIFCNDIKDVQITRAKYSPKCLEYLLASYTFHNLTQETINSIVMTGSIECIRICYKYGYAIQNGSFNMARIPRKLRKTLIERFEVFHENGYIFNPRDWNYIACQGLYNELKYLHEIGYNFEIAYNFNIYTHLLRHIWAYSGKNKYAKCIKYLFENGCPISDSDKKYIIEHNII